MHAGVHRAIVRPLTFTPAPAVDTREPPARALRAYLSAGTVGGDADEVLVSDNLQFI